MEYSVLTIGLPRGLAAALKNLIPQYSLRFIMPPSIQAADRLLNRQPFHLLIVDLEYLRGIRQSDWLVRLSLGTFLVEELIHRVVLGV